MKRKRRSDEDQQIELDWERNSESSSHNGGYVHPPTAKRRHVLDFGPDNEVDSEEEEEEELETWLIRKPKEVPIEWLQGLKFPRKVPEAGDVRAREWEAGEDTETGARVELEARFERSARTIYYVPNDAFQADDGSDDEEDGNIEIAKASKR